MKEPIRHDDAWALYLASLMGEAELALELERLDLSDELNSMEDAEGLRPILLQEVESARTAAEGTGD